MIVLAPPGGSPEPNAATERPVQPSNLLMSSTAASRLSWWSARGWRENEVMGGMKW